jgi:hypothetical protein
MYNMRPSAIFSTFWMNVPRHGFETVWYGGIHIAKDLRAVTPMESIARGKFGGGGNWT